VIEALDDDVDDVVVAVDEAAKNVDVFADEVDDDDAAPLPLPLRGGVTDLLLLLLLLLPARMLVVVPERDRPPPFALLLLLLLLPPAVEGDPDDEYNSPRTALLSSSK
jgi:hypothetical protein